VPHHAQPKPRKSMVSQDCTAKHFCSFSGKLLITSRGAPVDSLLFLEFELTKQHPSVIFFPFDPSVPSSPRSGLPISYAMAHRKLLNLEIIHINFFFFECKETPLSNLPLSGKWILYIQVSK